MSKPGKPAGCGSCALPIEGRSADGGRMAGFSYVEVLVATVLIALTLVPAIEALQPAMQGTGIHASETVRHFHLTAKLEEVLAEPFSTLDDEAQVLSDPTAPSPNYSDAPGANDRRRVYLARYDADNADGDGDVFSDTDEGLLWVRIELEGTSQAIECLTSIYD
jgi:type II secretory pathway pseudopilin PulG